MTEKEKTKQDNNNNGNKAAVERAKYRSVTQESRSEADRFLFDISDDEIIERTRLSLQEVVLVASEIMHEEATNPDRDPITMPLTKVRRLARMRANLSLQGGSRGEAVIVLRSHNEEEAAKAAFD